MAVQQSQRKNSSVAGRILPHSAEAEQAMLCCALIDRDAVAYMLEHLEEHFFSAEANQRIFAAMHAIRERCANVDLVTLENELKDLNAVGGMQYLIAVSNAVPDASNYAAYAKIITEKYILRSIVKSCSVAVEGAFNNMDSEELLNLIEAQIYEVAKEQEHGSLVSVSEITGSVMSKLEELAKSGAYRGVPTGFAGINSVTNGLQKGDLVLVAARPSVGKTAFAMNMVTNIALQKPVRTSDGKSERYVCAVFSLEMNKEQLTQRMMASVAGVSLEKINKGNLDAKDWKKLAEAKTALNSARIFIDDTSMIRPIQIMEKCQRLRGQEGHLDVIMIDYLQLLMSDRASESRQNEVAEITRYIKIMAKELNVPVVLLSQLSRKVESRQDKTPILSDLRESGAIEQDADIVMFIHRDKDVDHPTEKAEIIIAKHRNGALARIPMKWLGEFTRFVDDDTRGEGAFDATHEPPPQTNKDVIAPPEITQPYFTEEEPFREPNDEGNQERVEEDPEDIF